MATIEGILGYSNEQLMGMTDDQIKALLDKEKIQDIVAESIHPHHPSFVKEAKTKEKIKTKKKEELTNLLKELEEI